MHDLGAGVRADRRRCQAAREQADGEEGGHEGSDAVAQRRVRAFEGVRARNAGEVRGGEQQDAEVHGAGDDHRDRHIPPGRAQEAARADSAQLREVGPGRGIRIVQVELRGDARRDGAGGGRGGCGDRGECRGHAAGGEPVARQRGVRVDRVRHDRGAEDGCREQHRPRAVEARHQTPDDRAGFGRRDDDAEREADRDDHEQPDDHELEGARSALGLQEQQRDRDSSGDHSTPQQGQVEEQVERDRPADHLGDVGRHGDELGLQPERAPAPAASDAIAQGLGEAAPGDDPELGREVLDEPGHHIAEHDDPDQQVAVHGARGHVARDVARVEVGDPGDQGGADQPREAGERQPRVRGGWARLRAPGVVRIEASSPRDFSAYRKLSADVGMPKPAFGVSSRFARSTTGGVVARSTTGGRSRNDRWRGTSNGNLGR